MRSLKVFLLFVFLLFVFACVQKEKVEAIAEKQIANISLPSSKPDDAFWIKQALYNNNSAICELVSEENRTFCYSLFENKSLDACLKTNHSSCILYFAHYYNDTALCLFLNNQSEMEACIRSLLGTFEEDSKLAISLGKPEYCKDDECLLKLAFLYKNPQICEKMSSNTYEKICESLLFGKDSCEELPPFSKDYCYLYLATHYNKTFLCGKINVDNYLTQCLTYKAIKEKNLSSCMLLEYNSNRYDCLEAYALALCDEQGCERIDEEAPSYTSCYYNLALRCGNPSYCNNIEDSSLREKCYILSIYTGNVSEINSCLAVKHDVWRDKCLLEVAKINSSACNFVKIQNYKEKCLKQ